MFNSQFSSEKCRGTTFPSDGNWELNIVQTPYGPSFPKNAINGESVSGLSTVVRNTTFVTKAGATSNSSARIVVITAVGIDASTTPACLAAPVIPSIQVSPNATKGAATSDNTTAAATIGNAFGVVALSSCIPSTRIITGIAASARS